MDTYLEHHRRFFTKLDSLVRLDVGWDGNGGAPLKRKAFLAMAELLSMRPDLGVGAHVELLSRGGLKMTLFRAGCDLLVKVCTAGTIRVHLIRPGGDLEFEASCKQVGEVFLRDLEKAIPSMASPVIGRVRPDDRLFEEEREGLYCVRDDEGGFPLLIGRRTCSPSLVALHDHRDIPADLLEKQQLADGFSFSDLVRVTKKRDRNPGVGASV